MYTDKFLLGHPLQQYLDLRVKGSLDDIADVYNSYLEFFFIRDRSYVRLNSPRAWLSDALGVSPYTSAAFFAVPARVRERSRADLVAQVIWFAALVAANFEHVVEHGQRKFVVRTDGHAFGMDEGRPVWHRPVPGRPSTLRVAGGRLVDYPRGPVVRRQRPGAADKLRFWFEQQRPDDLEEIVFALGVQERRYDGGAESVAEILSRVPSAKDLAGIFRDARKFTDYEEPRIALFKILVPDLITVKRFQAVFGKLRKEVLLPMLPRQVYEWECALDTLEEEFLKGAEACRAEQNLLLKAA
jgi:hypothetical protein